MLRKIGIFIAIAVTVLVLSPRVPAEPAAPEKAPRIGEIGDYIKLEDDAYAWEKAEGESYENTLPDGTKTYELKLTSQVWQDITWTHRLIVAVPDGCPKETPAALLISGSGSGSIELFVLATVALQTKRPAAVLLDVPNQPLFDSLREDNLIAHTFVKAIETDDYTWPLLLPMTKSAVKAMDAVSEFMERDFGTEITGWVTSGASKRGWTTWLTAVVDERVKAITPVVYDNLDLMAQMKHQYKVWGEPSAMILPYTERGIIKLLLDEDPKALKVAKLVDPYSYRDRIKVPTAMIMGTNDPYWPVDAAALYSGKLDCKKYFLYIPNGGHDLGGFGGAGRATALASALVLSTAGELVLPELKWEFSENKGSVTLSVRSDARPVSIKFSSARTKTREFRNAVWAYSDVKEFEGDENAAGPYSAEASFEKPEEGYIAAFAEATYRHKNLLYTITTELRVFGKTSEK